MAYCGDSGPSCALVTSSPLLLQDDSVPASSSVETKAMVTPSSVQASFGKVDFTVDNLIADAAGNLQLLKCLICDELLTDPVQLKCLHNCCRQCIQSSATSECDRSLTCKICQEVCDTACSTTNNSFIESLVQEHRAELQPSLCTFCEEEDTEVPADLWCSQCEKNLCFNCLPGHRKYNKEHSPVLFDPQQAKQSSSSAAAALRLCRLHKKPFEHMCLNCKLPKCFDCALACSSSEHDMHFLKSPKTESFLSEVRLDVKKLKELLENKIGALLLCQKMPENLLAARSVDINKLKENKKSALQALESAYQEADDTLKDCYDKLAPIAQELASFAENLKTKAVYAVSYCEQIERSGDVVSYIQQEAALRTRLQSLAAMVHDVREPICASHCVSLNAACALPSDMELFASGLIGCPKVATNDMFATSAHAAAISPLARENVSIGISKTCASTQTPEIQCQEAEVDYTISQAMNCISTVGDGYIGVMRVGEEIRSTMEADRCYDLAVTLRNTVVVAQGEGGLFEYSFVGDNHVSAWKPLPSDSVTAVDVVDECQIVVGLREAEAIVVLKCYTVFFSNLWFEHVRLKLHAAPFTLSVYGDIVAVSEWMQPEFGRRSSHPGPTLNMFSLSSQSLILREKLHFNIFSIAATNSTVAIASWNRGGPDRCDQSSQSYLVASYRYNGTRRWQREFGERVYGICASPSTPVLYLAFQNSVYAIGENTGRNLISVCMDNTTIEKPWRLSVSKGNGPAVLTVLESDFKTIRVYPIVAHTMLPASG